MSQSLAFLRRTFILDVFKHILRKLHDEIEGARHSARFFAKNDLLAAPEDFDLTALEPEVLR